jgi:hypothetical protein
MTIVIGASRPPFQGVACRLGSFIINAASSKSILILKLEPKMRRRHWVVTGPLAACTGMPAPDPARALTAGNLNHGGSWWLGIRKSLFPDWPQCGGASLLCFWAG